jgi:hypothetical protein
MDRKLIDKMAQLWQEVVEKKHKKLDPVDDDELKGDHDDRDDKDIDNDGDVDGSDEYLHNRRKAVKKAIKKEEAQCEKCEGECKCKQESSDLNDKEATKALKHDCATHVTSEKWGYGECISGQHTLEEQEDGTAIVTHYDIMFEHGIEMDVPVEDLTIVAEKSHMHASKKYKVKEALSSPMKSSQKKTDHEGIMDKESPGGKKWASDQISNDSDDREEKSHDDASKAGRVTKQSPARGPADKLSSGDKKILKGGK